MGLRHWSRVVGGDAARGRRLVGRGGRLGGSRRGRRGAPLVGREGRRGGSRRRGRRRGASELGAPVVRFEKSALEAECVLAIVPGHLAAAERARLTGGSEVGSRREAASKAPLRRRGGSAADCGGVVADPHPLVVSLRLANSLLDGIDMLLEAVRNRVAAVRNAREEEEKGAAPTLLEDDVLVALRGLLPVVEVVPGLGAAGDRPLRSRSVVARLWARAQVLHKARKGELADADAVRVEDLERIRD